MPSQRLLKMLDPLGHTPSQVLASSLMKVVVYGGSPKICAWIARELAGVGDVLRATSFRHVSTSLRPGARPMVSLAVLDFGAMSEMDVATLTSARWMGYRGAIVAITRAPIAPAVQTLVGIDAVVHEGVDGELRAAVEHLATG